MPNRHIGHRTPEGGWRWEPQDSQQSKGGRRLLLIGGLAAAAVFAAAGLGLAGMLLSSHGPDTAPSTAVPTVDGAVFSMEVWNPEHRRWQTTNLDGSGPPDQSVSFLLVVDDSGAPSHHVSVSFQCRNSRPAQLVAPRNPVAAITEPGPGRIRPDSTALAAALWAWSATFPEPPTWSAAITCSDPQILEFAMIQLGDPAYFMWQVEIAAATAGDLVVAVTVDGGAAQSLTINLGP